MDGDECGAELQTGSTGRGDGVAFAWGWRDKEDREYGATYQSP